MILLALSDSMFADIHSIIIGSVTLDSFVMQKKSLLPELPFRLIHPLCFAVLQKTISNAKYFMTVLTFEWTISLEPFGLMMFKLTCNVKFSLANFTLV